jgi:hypothetical protein
MASQEGRDCLMCRASASPRLQIAQATPSSSLSSQWRLTRWRRLPGSVRRLPGARQRRDSRMRARFLTGAVDPRALAPVWGSTTACPDSGMSCLGTEDFHFYGKALPNFPSHSPERRSVDCRNSIDFNRIELPALQPRVGMGLAAVSLTTTATFPFQDWMTWNRLDGSAPLD